MLGGMCGDWAGLDAGRQDGGGTHARVVKHDKA